MAHEHSWQYRAVELTKSNTTSLGMILLGVLGKQARLGPSVSHACAIMPDGMVVVNYTDHRGVYHPTYALIHIGELIDAFRRLADQLKLEDWEREALFRDVRQWCAIDYRVTPMFDFGGGHNGLTN